MATKKHPSPVHLRAKVDRKTPLNKKLAKSQDCLASQQVADPQNKLGTEATTLSGARSKVLSLLAQKSQIQAAAEQNSKDLVLAIDAHDNALIDYSASAVRLADGDVSLLTALSVEAAKRPARPAEDTVDAPVLTVKPGKDPGEVELQCAPVAFAGAYVFEYKLEPSQVEDPWLSGGESRRKALKVSGLVSGQAIRARARAIGTKSGPWSDEALGKAR